MSRKIMSEYTAVAWVCAGGLVAIICLIVSFRLCDNALITARATNTPEFVWLNEATFGEQVGIVHLVMVIDQSQKVPVRITACGKKIQGNQEEGFCWGTLEEAKAAGAIPCPKCQRLLQPFVEWRPASSSPQHPKPSGPE